VGVEEGHQESGCSPAGGKGMKGRRKNQKIGKSKPDYFIGKIL